MKNILFRCFTSYLMRLYGGRENINQLYKIHFGISFDEIKEYDEHLYNLIKENMEGQDRIFEYLKKRQEKEQN